MRYIYEIFEDFQDGELFLANARLRRSFYAFLEQGVKEHSLMDICENSGISKRRMEKIIRKNPDLKLSEVASILYSLGKESTLCIEEYGSARAKHREVQSDNSEFTKIIKNSFYVVSESSSCYEDDYVVNEDDYVVKEKIV